MRIDLNADVGEAVGPWPMGDDAVAACAVALRRALAAAGIEVRALGG